MLSNEYFPRYVDSSVSADAIHNFHNLPGGCLSELTVDRTDARSQRGLLRINPGSGIARDATNLTLRLRRLRTIAPQWSSTLTLLPRRRREPDYDGGGDQIVLAGAAGAGGAAPAGGYFAFFGFGGGWGFFAIFVDCDAALF